MIYENFAMKKDGFTGHLAEPNSGSDRAVIIIMGGEQSLLPGIKFAERFADHGITGLAVSLFGAEGLPDSPDRIPLDMFEPAVKYLRKKNRSDTSAYTDSLWVRYLLCFVPFISEVLKSLSWSRRHTFRLRVHPLIKGK